MLQGYKTIAQDGHAQLVEKRSRFIGCAFPVSTATGALEHINQQKALYHDARHHCYCYILRSGQQKFSDDGEPSGTAGMPMLEQLTRNEISDILVIVTRYFGGILLGTGGLVRAYSACAKATIAATCTVEMRPCFRASVCVPYHMHTKTLAVLQRNYAKVTEEIFTETVTIIFNIDTNLMANLEKELAEISGASIFPTVLGEDFLQIKII